MLEKVFDTPNAFGMHPVRRVDLAGVGQGLSPVHACGFVEELFGRCDGGRRALSGDGGAELARAIQGPPVIDQFVGETELDGPHTVDPLGVQQQSAGDVARDPPGEECQNEGRDIADGDLGVGETGAALGDDQIAGGGEPAPTTNGCLLYTSDAADERG